MQAAVAVRLGIGNVVFLLDQRQVVLPHEHVRYRVNILDKRTDHADTANIIQIVYHGLQRDRKSAPLELADNAARTFDAALDGIDRAWLARNTRLVAQNIQLGFDLADAISSSSSCCDSRSIAKKSASSIVFPSLGHSLLRLLYHIRRLGTIRRRPPFCGLSGICR